MSLLQEIDKQLVKALKSGDKIAATTLRGLKSDIKYFQIDNKLDKVTDEDIQAVMSSAAKRRRDSIEQFKAGGRQDLVDQETRELEIIGEFLPKQLSGEELEKIVADAIAESGAASPKEIGRVMKIVMPMTQGRADGKVIQQLVVKLLQG